MTRTQSWLAAITSVLVIVLGIGVGTASAGNGRTTTPPGHDRAPVSSGEEHGTSTAPGQQKKAPAPTPGGGGNVTTSIPAVAFTASVVAVGGHLRTPVLLADPTVTGKVQVIGAGQGNDCRATLTQGVVSWLDCTVSTTAVKNAQIVVTLSDGRRVTQPIGFAAG